MLIGQGTLPYALGKNVGETEGMDFSSAPVQTRNPYLQSRPRSCPVRTARCPDRSASVTGSPIGLSTAAGCRLLWLIRRCGPARNAPLPETARRRSATVGATLGTGASRGSPPYGPPTGPTRPAADRCSDAPDNA